MLDFDLLKNILVISIASGVVVTLMVQKIKEIVNKKIYIFLANMLCSAILGTLFAKFFSSASWIYSAWCGFFTFIDADLLYKMLEDKVFTSFKDMKSVTTLERND